MPEYLTPGVYIEEVSYRSKSIEGVSTTTTGFIGPTRYGPTDLIPDVVTSLGDFEAVYGDRYQLKYNPPMHNYMWHAVRAFFEEGGQRLYVVRTFAPLDNAQPLDAQIGNLYNDGCARQAVQTADGRLKLDLQARFPGEAGNMGVRFTLRMGQSILAGDKVPAGAASAGAQASPPASPPGSPPTSPPSASAPSYTPRVGALFANDVVYIRRKSIGGAGGFYRVDQGDATNPWLFTPQRGTNASALKLSDLTFDPNPANSDSVRLVTLTVTIMPNTSDALPLVWDGLPLDPNHTRNNVPDSWTAQFAQKPANASIARSTPLILAYTGADDVDCLDLLTLLFAQNTKLQEALLPFDSAGQPKPKPSDDTARSVDFLLAGGNDGTRPGADLYEGKADDTTSVKTGLKAFEDIDDISIIAAPGSTFDYNNFLDDASTIINLLIVHAEQMRYRIAVLDCGDNKQSIADVRAMRGRIDTTYAAFYYPWIRVLDPVTRQEISLPPSGFVAGIYARNDVNRGVYKAPANEVVNLAIGFETMINKNQQAVLNPEGINCFRFFEGRGFRLWGARTATSDPEWKYVNLRRYFAYLEHSLDKGTQWVVFEPNGDALWANVRRTVEDFLFNEWQSGALLGEKPENAYFVRCDRTTMTQNDLDNGRLVCLVGVAPLRPAEFVIFRIGQWTGSSAS